MQKIITTHKPTLLGPETSIGLHSERQTYFGPLHYYLLLFPIILFKGNIIGAVILTGLVNLLGGIAIYLVLKKQSFKSKIVGLSFYLFSPLSVQYSRFFWNPNWLPALIGWSFFFFLRALTTDSKIVLWLAGFMVGLALQLHYIAAPLLIGLTLSIILEKKRQSLKYLILLWLGIGFGFLPVILFEVRHNFFITKAILFHLFSKGSQTIDWHLLGLKLWQNLEALCGRSLGIVSYSLIDMKDESSIWSRLSVIFIVSLIFWNGLKEIKRNDKVIQKVFKVSIIYLVLGLIFAGFWELAGATNRIEDRYLLPLLPVLVLLISVSIKGWLSDGKLRFVFYLLLGIVMINMIQTDWKIVTATVGVNQTQVNYHIAQNIAKVIADDVKKEKMNGQFNLANIIDGNTRATYYRYFLYLEGVQPLPVEKYKEAKILYVITKSMNPADVKTYPVWEIRVFNPAKIALLDKIRDGIKIYKLTR